MTRPPEQRLLTEANAGLHASNPGTPLGQAVALAVAAGPGAGPTGSRPAAPVAGSLFLDTTLGRPIWWDGATWIDATGAPV